MGKDHLDQIKVILSVLGSPEPHELEWLKDHRSAKKFVIACEKSVRKPWPELYPSSKPEAWTPDCVALIDECLRFDPNHRCTVEQALESKFMAELHDPSDERVAKHTIDWSFDSLPLTKRAIQNAVYQEAGRMHPEIFDRDAALLAERKIVRPTSKENSS
jgi:serine/threonine protein kinase